MPKIVEKSAEQRDAEGDVAEVESELGPFVVAAETTRMPMVFSDAAAPGHPFIFANDAFIKLFGFPREEVLGQCFNFMMMPDSDAQAEAKIAAAFACDTDHDPEIHYRRKDGSGLWAQVLINPVRDEAGTVIQHFASFIDLTRHRDEQSHARMMIEELNHRVKNTLATVQSIVTQGLRDATDPAAIRTAIESRIFALSRSHDLLTRESWEGADLDALVRNAMEPFGVAAGRAERFEVSGTDIRMPPKATLALGVALHELATNAVKYGAFSNDAGCVRISWTVEPRPDGDRLIIRWCEAGGPTVTPPARRGFGSRVIERGLAHELEGVVALDYRAAGVVCTIDIPAPSGCP